MPREAPAFRDNLQDVLEFFGDRRLLTVSDIKRYTGLADVRTVKRRFPGFNGPYISAVTFARFLAGGGAA